MPIILNPQKPVDINENKRETPELVHGGFRDNVHYNTYEALANEGEGDPMGRDILRRTGSVSDEEAQVSGGIAPFMKAQPNKNAGPDGLRTSKWSKK